MAFLEGDIVKLKDAGDGSEIGRLCSIQEGGYWVYFAGAGCLYVPLNSLEHASGDAPQCPGDCPPDN